MMSENGGKVTDEKRRPERADSTAPLRFPVAEWVAFVSALLFVFSLCWEWGFWNALNVSFSDIPLAFEDMADSMLAWLPKFGLLIFGITVYGLLTRRIEGFRSEEELVRGSPYPRLIKFLRENEKTPWLVVTLMAMVVSSYLDGEVHPFVVLMAVALLWWYFMPWVFDHPRAPKKDVFFLLLYFTPVLCLYIYMSGRAAAGDIIAESKPALVYLKVDNAVQEKRLIFLRNSHEFVHAYDPEQKMLVVLPWPLIDRTATDATPAPGIQIPFIPRYNYEIDRSEQ